MIVDKTTQEPFPCCLLLLPHPFTMWYATAVFGDVLS